MATPRFPAVGADGKVQDRHLPDRLSDTAPGGLADTYGTKPYIQAATGEVETLMNPQRIDRTIATAFPNVTLAQVQALDAQATLDDSADWFEIQSLIDKCASQRHKTLKIPQGTYYISRGLDLSGLEFGTYLDMHGVQLRATQKMPHMILIEHRGNWWKARRITIQGLELRGNFLADVGVKLARVQEWNVDVKVHECYVGIALSDVWYGALSTSTVLQDCLVGLAFNTDQTGEINTVQIANLKIGFATSKTNFVDSPNADSIGIRISTFLGGIELHSVVVEGVDYGIKYANQRAGSGADEGLLRVTSCYWEAIKKRVFDFSELGEAGFANYLNSLIITGNRFNVPAASESIFGPVLVEIIGNQPLAIRVQDTPVSRVLLRIDDSVTLTKNPTSSQVFVDRLPTVPVNLDHRRFAEWGNKNPYPQGKGMLYTVQHAAYRTAPPVEGLRASGAPSKLFPAYSITGRPTVHYPSVGGNPNGPVIQSPDGSWHMILVGNDGALSTHRVRNISRLDEALDSRSGKELHYLTSTAEIGASFLCIDIDKKVTLGELNGKRGWIDHLGRLQIGTTEELIAEFPNLANGVRVFDVSTGQAAYVASSSFLRFSWFGDATGERVLGTSAQRPAAPSEGLIYYDTDAKTYSKFLNGSWQNFTPNNIT